MPNLRTAEVHDSKAEGANLKISVVVAMYNVAEYLPRFLQSIDSQVAGRFDLELIFVNDGSPDDSAQIVERWAQGSPYDVSVISKENGGVSSARNAGLDNATGEWVTFPDPDDFLDSHYFRTVSKFIFSDEDHEISVIAANLLRHFEATGENTNSHALSFKFDRGTRSIAIAENPNFIQMHAASAFYRLSEIDSNNIRFVEELPLSEDAVFTAEVLSLRDNPRLGLAADSTYFYVKRAAGNSAIDGSIRTRAAYFNRFEHGYFPLLERVRAAQGAIPEWLANYLLYELRWIFQAQTRAKTRASFLSKSEQERFLEIAKQALAYCTREWILNYHVTGLLPEIRELWLALAGFSVSTRKLFIARLDVGRRLVQARYYFSGDLPDEAFYIDGSRVTPVAMKIRKLPYFDQDALHERIAWLPAQGQLSVRIDNVLAELSYGGLATAKFTRTDRDVWSRFDAFDRLTGESDDPFGFVDNFPPLIAAGRVAVGRVLGPVRDRFSKTQWRIDRRSARRSTAIRSSLRRQVSSPWIRRRFRSAWVFMDRIGLGNDNAEHLYRYVRDEHSDVNIWFILDKSSPDWARLKSEGFKLINYGSRDHRLVMHFAEHLISSHIDVPIVAPFGMDEYVYKPRWNFTFLQHGVTIHDLSDWFNTKDIARMITTTPDETASLRDDFTAYELTDREVAMTGMPRLDALVKRRARGEHSKLELLIMPTWRDGLFAPAQRGTKYRELAAPLEETQFYRSWMALLNHEKLRTLVEAGLHVKLLPHPMFEGSLRAGDLPDYVTLLSYTTCNVQDEIISASVVMSDYSSVTFDAAFVGTPLVYFQFDAEEVYGGGHMLTRGYFDYARDGYGPVASTPDEAAEAVEIAISGQEDEKYAERRRLAFPNRDGQNSKRVYESIIALNSASIRAENVS